MAAVIIRVTERYLSDNDRQRKKMFAAKVEECMNAQRIYMNGSKPNNRQTAEIKK
jgi:hypothetical protein